MTTTRRGPSPALLALALGAAAPASLFRGEVIGLEVREADGETVVVVRIRGCPPPVGPGRGRSGDGNRPLDGALTPRERAVAELVADGLPNEAIARRLHLSVRTVTSHLDHVYAHLGIHTRAALASLMTELRLTVPEAAEARPAPPVTATPGRGVSRR